LLTYTLIQLYLKATHREELATKTIETLKQEERLGKNPVIVYAEKYFAGFDLDEYTDIILYLKTVPRERMRRWIKGSEGTRSERPKRTDPPADSNSLVCCPRGPVWGGFPSPSPLTPHSFRKLKEITSILPSGPLESLRSNEKRLPPISPPWLCLN